jgi:enolase
VSDTGAICPQFDRPEQGMDLIQDACRELGFTEGEFNIVLNLAGQEIFDYVRFSCGFQDLRIQLFYTILLNSISYFPFLPLAYMLTSINRI